MEKKPKEKKVLFNALIGIGLKSKMEKVNELTNLSLSEMTRRALEVWIIREEAKIRLANPTAFDKIYHPEQQETKEVSP
jgi:hypothetical protein